jgi:hypothetical protein
VAKFREFYVQPGAGSNFLAGKCLWQDASNEFAPKDVSQNEFFFDRVKSDSKVMSYDIRNSDPRIEVAKYYDCPDKSILSESARIKPILIELDKFICDFYQAKGTEDLDDGVFEKDNRKTVIDNCAHIWREDFSIRTHAFWHLFDEALFHGNDISEPVVQQIREVEDYFAKCREYYYDECERNNWDMFQIGHAHQFISTSPRLKLPKNMITMAMEMDAEMNMYTSGLIDIKTEKSIEDNYVILTEGKNDAPQKSENLFINKSVKLSDSSVSFRKIYFENNTEEVRKMFTFFDNEDYFDKNIVQIMSEFRQYHDDNMKLVQKLTPKLYSKLND